MIPFAAGAASRRRHVRHDVVAAALFLARRRLEIDPAEVRAHLRDRLVGIGRPSRFSSSASHSQRPATFRT
jgi:hypothetical protein